MQIFGGNPLYRATKRHLTDKLSSSFSVTLLFYLNFTSHNIHYITPITRHCHANNLPSTEQAAKTQLKQDKSFSFIFHRF